MALTRTYQYAAAAGLALLAGCASVDHASDTSFCAPVSFVPAPAWDALDAQEALESFISGLLPSSGMILDPQEQAAAIAQEERFIQTVQEKFASLIRLVPGHELYLSGDPDYPLEELYAYLSQIGVAQELGAIFDPAITKQAMESICKFGDGILTDVRLQDAVAAIVEVEGAAFREIYFAQMLYLYANTQLAAGHAPAPVPSAALLMDDLARDVVAVMDPHAVPPGLDA